MADADGRGEDGPVTESDNQTTKTTGVLACFHAWQQRGVRLDTDDASHHNTARADFNEKSWSVCVCVGSVTPYH